MARRSDCPISFSLDLLGDRWTLLVVRDLALKGKRSFSELHNSEESIATNILADRLARLTAGGLIVKRRDPQDKRRFVYQMTHRGADLLSVLVDLIVWGATHDEETAAPASFIRAAKKNRGALLRRLRADLDPV